MAIIEVLSSIIKVANITFTKTITHTITHTTTHVNILSHHMLKELKTVAETQIRWCQFMHTRSSSKELIRVKKLC